MTNLNFQKANCPICHQEYVYVPSYKPATCGKYNCIHKWLHPKLANKKERR